VSILDSLNDYYNPAIKRANLAAIGDGVTFYQGDLTDAAFVAEGL
jgi:UDP-glucuronate 4-epimerase